MTTLSVQSDIIMALKDSHKQTTYCLNTLTNIACVVGIKEEGVGIGWQKT